MIFLYLKSGKLRGQYNSIEECSKATGYSISKLNDCADTPGLIIGNCFISFYRWRNYNSDHRKYANQELGKLSDIQIEKVLIKLIKDNDVDTLRKIQEERTKKILSTLLEDDNEQSEYIWQ